MNFTKICEKEYKEIKASVSKDKTSYWYGLPSMRYMEKYRSYLYEQILLYRDESSSFYHDRELIADAELYMDALLQQQDENGFLSLYDCNISSAPDTAFRLHWFGMARRLLKKDGDSAWNGVSEKIEQFTVKAAEGLLTGGFHTPNHRWVISCALSFAYEITGDERYKARVERILREGIDVNGSGQWSECSNSIYNAVCDIMLYHVDEILHIPYLREAIEKNLNMMKYLFHPDRNIVTEYSIRQDKAKKVKMSGEYAAVFALMAVKNNDGEYAFLCRKACETLTDCPIFMMYREVYDFNLPESKPISDKYTVLLNENEREGFGNKVLRYRDGKKSVTFMEKEKNTCYIQYGNVRIYGIHIVIGWFGAANISFDNLKKTGENTYEMKTVLINDYLDLLPEEEICCSTNFYAMNNDKRKHIGAVSISVSMKLKIEKESLKLYIDAGDRKDVLIQTVFLLDEDADISGGHKEDDRNVFADEKVRISKNGDSITILSDGKSDFDMLNLREYSLPDKTKSIRANFMTPCSKEFTILFD